MSERSGASLQPLHEGFIVDPSDTRLEGEHTLSVRIATVLEGLEQLRQHFDHTYSTRIDETEAQRLRLLVEDTYHAHFAGQGREDYDDGFDGPLERQTDAIGEHLRGVWLESYYKPRTREATLEDFQGWLDGYVAKYGEKALAKTTRVGSDFLNTYRPFRNPIFEGRVTSDLRTSTSDIMLIPGCGARSIDVIEGEGTTVERALPQAFDHHTIYTLSTAPNTWFGQIKVPNDINPPRPEALTS